MSKLLTTSVDVCFKQSGISCKEKQKKQQRAGKKKELKGNICVCVYCCLCVLRVCVRLCVCEQAQSLWK